MTKTIHTLFSDNLRLSNRLRSFCHNDDLVPGTFSPTLHEQFVDPLNLKIVFGDQNDVSTARFPSLQCQPACMPSHCLHHKDPPMRACSCSETINLFCDHIYGGLKSQGIICPGKIFIDGLWNPNHFHTIHIKFVGYVNGI